MVISSQTMSDISLESKPKAGEITITRRNRCKRKEERHCEFVWTPTKKGTDKKFGKNYITSPRGLCNKGTYFSVTDDGEHVNISFMVCTKKPTVDVIVLSGKENISKAYGSYLGNRFCFSSGVSDEMKKKVDTKVTAIKTSVNEFVEKSGVSDNEIKGFAEQTTKSVMEVIEFYQTRYVVAAGFNKIVNNTTEEITKTSNDKTYCVATRSTPLPQNKVTSWSIKILKSRDNDGGEIYIGVAPFGISQNEDENYYKCGWYFESYSSTLWSGPPHNYEGKEYGPSKREGEYVHTGDSVGVVMNTTKTKGKLSFVVNGVNLGVAYDGIPLDEPLAPCVLLYYQGDSVELII